MVLSDGKKGDSFLVLNIETELKVKKRLQDMGLTKGIRIKIMSFYAHNAYIVNIRGSRVVIGKDIANTIFVEPIECNQCSIRTGDSGQICKTAQNIKVG